MGDLTVDVYRIHPNKDNTAINITKTLYALNYVSYSSIPA